MKQLNPNFQGDETDVMVKLYDAHIYPEDLLVMMPDIDQPPQGRKVF